LPKNQNGRVIGNQLVRSATSVGANYELHAEGARKLSLLQRLVLLLRKLMNLSIGWK